MSDQSVTLKVTVALPQTVILPLALAQRHGVDRRLVISKREISVALGVANWLRRDARYTGWFEAEQVAVEQIAETANVALGGKQPGDETPDVTAWSLEWNVPTLRAYAAANGVELAKDDRKDDVIGKLRAAGLPEAAEAQPEKR